MYVWKEFEESSWLWWPFAYWCLSFGCSQQRDSKPFDIHNSKAGKLRIQIEIYPQPETANSHLHALPPNRPWSHASSAATSHLDPPTLFALRSVTRKVFSWNFINKQFAARRSPTSPQNTIKPSLTTSVRMVCCFKPTRSIEMVKWCITGEFPDKVAHSDRKVTCCSLSLHDQLNVLIKQKQIRLMRHANKRMIKLRYNRVPWPRGVLVVSTVLYDALEYVSDALISLYCVLTSPSDKQGLSRVVSNIHIMSTFMFIFLDVPIGFNFKYGLEMGIT